MCSGGYSHRHLVSFEKNVLKTPLRDNSVWAGSWVYIGTHECKNSSSSPPGKGPWKRGAHFAGPLLVSQLTEIMGPCVMFPVRQNIFPPHI